MLTRRIFSCHRTFCRSMGLGIRAKHSLPDLPYDYNALEPTISADIMRVHHQKHHATYVNNLNIAEEKLQDAIHRNDASAACSQLAAMNFNGGGHINHSIFWNNLAPTSRQGGTPPSSGPLKEALTEQFGGIDPFIQLMNSSGLAVQGSGWVWLGYNKQTKRLEITTCANQDPLVTKGLIPLLGLDVWEHAYYLQYKSARADYLKRIWEVVHWKDVTDRYTKAITTST